MTLESPILDALTHYRLTGEIQEALYTGFDQNGGWNGLSIDVSGAIPKDLKGTLIALSQEKLPPEKLVKTNSAGETTLLSSFCAGNNTSAIINYHHVLGNVHTQTAEHASMPNLRSVGRNLTAACIEHLDAPQLESVGQNMFLKSCQTCSLPQLKSVGKLFDGEQLRHIELPKLKTLGTSLSANTAKTVKLPELEAANGIYTSATKVLHADKLKINHGSFYINQATDIHLPELKFVKGFMDTSSAKNYYDPKLLIGETWVKHPEAKTHWIEKQMRKALKNTPTLEI